MIHCLSCKRYPTDVKVIPYGSDFPSDEFMVSLISKDLPNSMSISSADVVELPSGCKFAVGSKLHVVNGNDGSEVYVWDSEEFVLVESNVEPKEPDGKVTPEGEILDSWDTIIANIDNGTYSTKYSVGNYKPLDLGSEGTINMQIVAIDGDELADGSGYAPLTFLSIELMPYTQKMNTSNTTVGGWEAMSLRSYVKSFKSSIPTNVASRINNVTKYSNIYQNGGIVKDVESVEDIWIPSGYELGYRYESQGVRYNTLFNDYASHIKKIGENENAWWTRSVATASNFTYVDIFGSNRNGGVSSSYGICLGFCLGLEPAYTVTFKDETGTTTLDEQSVKEGQTAMYGGTTPVSATDPTLEFLGWSTTTDSHQADATLTNIQANMTVYAAFEEPKVDIKKYLNYTTNETNNTMTITGLNTSLIVSDQLDEIRIPDTIDGYHVILG